MTTVALLDKFARAFNKAQQTARAELGAAAEHRHFTLASWFGYRLQSLGGRGGIVSMLVPAVLIVAVASSVALPPAASGLAFVLSACLIFTGAVGVGILYAVLQRFRYKQCPSTVFWDLWAAQLLALKPAEVDTKRWLYAYEVTLYGRKHRQQYYLGMSAATTAFIAFLTDDHWLKQHAKQFFAPYPYVGLVLAFLAASIIVNWIFTPVWWLEHVGISLKYRIENPSAPPPFA